MEWRSEIPQCEEERGYRGWGRRFRAGFARVQKWVEEGCAWEAEVPEGGCEEDERGVGEGVRMEGALDRGDEGVDEVRGAQSKGGWGGEGCRARGVMSDIESNLESTAEVESCEA